MPKEIEGVRETEMTNISNEQLAELIARAEEFDRTWDVVPCVNEIASALRELQALRESDRWKSFRPETMPDPGTEILVINANDEWGIEIVAVVANNHIRACDNADYRDFANRGYTDWRPLPSAPKTGEPR